MSEEKANIGLDHLLERILSYLSIIESYYDVYYFLRNYRIVGIGSAVFFLAIKAIWKQRFELELDGLVHALITGIGSAVVSCLFLFFSNLKKVYLSECLYSLRSNGKRRTISNSDM